MQSQFRLSKQEVQDAVQVYVAKHQRSRNLKVSSFAADPAQEGTFIVAAEVEIKPPQKRQKRNTTVTQPAKTGKVAANNSPLARKADEPTNSAAALKDK